MPIISVKTFKSAVKTSQIYKKLEKKGKIIYHYYPQNDRLPQKLQELGELYKANPTKKLKKRVLTAERKILYQELENPQLTIVRNAKAILKGITKKLNYDKFIAWVQGLNIEGIYRIEALKSPFGSKFTDKKVGKLKKAFRLLEENNKEAILTKQHIIELLSFHSENVALRELLRSTKSKMLKHLIKQKTSEFNYDYLSEMMSLSKKPLQYNRLKLFLMNLDNKTSKTIGTETQKEFATNLISDLLSKENIKPAIKKLAAWGAGKYKSDKSFAIIKKIALNRKEKDVRLREMSIHSCAMYIKNRPDEVREILTEISKEETIFSPLGKILMDKVNGKYHGQQNREYNYLKTDEKTAEKYKETIDYLINLVGIKRNTHIDNEIDRGMLFFRNILNLIKKNGTKSYIIDDSLTKIDVKETGVRNINAYPGTNTGDFYDTINGAHNFTKKYTILGKRDFQESSHYNSFAHEYGHCWQFLLKEEDFKKTKELYKAAMKGHRTLDSYAAIDELEYFATGCEAMCSIYKPHSQFINEFNIYSHTKYELLAKDPKLYHFIEEMFAKYSKPIN